ncbi:inactive sodium-dependent neutral amino acid transporter B(0)AT3 isoform X2 [Hemibagrus wyckioides]|uniref:inactive sodium-dependent neutral amino acid transporter B(0)AT3 isoform X2 n=1 Tax=Hemibagrus wyckioides TaxID=337641 RepID=UPI00266D25CF|nr:inactive sodium-dependent neutral amino acid transporter B(0)AT3 isoform X2 [Hemibagrus wyckioides]
MEDRAAEDEKKERPKWDNKLQYLLTCIGFAVGLGNVWRFPYLCQIYGGGVASMLVSFLVGMFYNTILAWVLWYFFNSFQDPLPWSQCPLTENQTEYMSECVEGTPVNYYWYRETLNITPDIASSGSLQWWLVLCVATAWSIVYICFIRGIETIGKAVYVTATFPYIVLTVFLVRALTLPGAAQGLEYLFTPDWQVLLNPQVWLDAATQIFFSLSLAFGGLIAFSSYNPEKNNCERDALLVGCINSATSLYASIPIFSILGFKATTNHNNCIMSNILKLTNEFSFSDQNITMENYKDWLSYLNSTHPVEVDSLKLRHCDLQRFLDQSASGTGLAFIVFTEAVIEMPASQVWAVLFFIMLFSLGLSSMFGNLEGVLTPLLDLNILPKSIPKELFTALICVISFLVALIFTMGSGNYWLEIFNSYVGSVPLLIIAFFEIIAVVVFYGMGRFSEDIEFMTGRKPNIFWRVCWMGISPVMLLVVLVAYVVVQVQVHPEYPAWNPQYSKFPEAEVKPYPDWVFAICVLLSALPVIPIPIVALYHLIRRLTHSHTHTHSLSDIQPENPYTNGAYIPDQ